VLTVEGDKFVIARWILDYYLEDIRSYTNSYDDESIVKMADVAVLRNKEDFNKLGSKLMEELQEFHRELEATGDEELEPELGFPDPIVWSWHIPDPQDDPIPKRMVLFRGEQEVCTVWFEQIDPLD
jgi:hypothetical protein